MRKRRVPSGVPDEAIPKPHALEASIAHHKKALGHFAAPVRVQQRVHIFHRAKERDESQHAGDYASAIDANVYLVLRNKSLIHSSSMASLSQHSMQTAAYLIDITRASG